MITLIFGENTYERDSQLDKLISQSFDRYDGLDINTNQLSQIILGVSLFNPSNISVIYSLSENKDLWNFLGENLTDDIISRAEIILIDSKNFPNIVFKGFNSVFNRIKFFLLCDYEAVSPLMERDKLRILNKSLNSD